MSCAEFRKSSGRTVRTAHLTLRHNECEAGVRVAGYSHEDIVDIAEDGGDDLPVQLCNHSCGAESQRMRRLFNKIADGRTTAWSTSRSVEMTDVWNKEDAHSYTAAETADAGSLFAKSGSLAFATTPASCCDVAPGATRTQSRGVAPYHVA
jgi:hypothetical protein